ncbi:MAG: hypothetical protein DA328_06555 [Nitrososphaeraceae archaeon]|nr:hypothetical protein [Nitrososphaeraceae archaeon]
MSSQISAFFTGTLKMPHVVLTNVYDFEIFYNNFKKDVLILNDKNNKEKTNSIIKFEEVLLNKYRNLILIKTVSIENTNTSQTYYIMVNKKDTQITIRLDPLTDPTNKTDAVKISLATIAKQYKKLDPTISIGKTNLEQYLQ